MRRESIPIDERPNVQILLSDACTNDVEFYAVSTGSEFSVGQADSKVEVHSNTWDISSLCSLSVLFGAKRFCSRHDRYHVGAPT